MKKSERLRGAFAPKKDEKGPAPFLGASHNGAVAAATIYSGATVEGGWAGISLLLGYKWPSNEELILAMQKDNIPLAINHDVFTPFIDAFDAEKARDETDDAFILWTGLSDAFDAVFNFYKHHISNKAYKRADDMNQDIASLRKLVFEFEGAYRAYEAGVQPLSKEWYTKNNWHPDPTVEYIWLKYSDMWKRVQVGISIISYNIAIMLIFIGSA